MDDREALLRIGGLLGLVEDGPAARRLSGALEEGEATAWLLASAEVLRKPLGEREFGLALEILRSPDLAENCSPGSGESLARRVYDRLQEALAPEGSLPPYEIFLPHFSEFLGRAERTLEGLSFIAGINKEIVSLESSSAVETVEEIRHLAGRNFGELAHLPGNMRPAMALTRYIHGLLDRYDGKGVDHETCDRVREVLDRLSLYPGYLKMLDSRRKAESARPLSSAANQLRNLPGAEQEKEDLLTALGLMLFSIFPSVQLVEYLGTLRPGQGSRYLRYEQGAVLALNYLLLGKPELAAGLARQAGELAPDADAKAYAGLLEGCIHVQRKEYPKAAEAFDRSLQTAGRRLRPLILFYRGVLEYETGQPELALASFRGSRSGCGDGGDTMALCANIGTCHMVLGDLAAAIQAFEEAENSFPYSGRLSARQLRAVTFGHLGIVYLSMREYDLASEYFRKALRAAREAGEGRRVADQLANLGLACKAKRDYGGAARYFTSALNYSCSVDYPQGVLYAREQLRQTLALDRRHGELRAIERKVIRRHPRYTSLLLASRR